MKFEDIHIGDKLLRVDDNIHEEIIQITHWEDNDLVYKVIARFNPNGTIIYNPADLDECVMDEDIAYLYRPLSNSEQERYLCNYPN